MGPNTMDTKNRGYSPSMDFGVFHLPKEPPKLNEKDCTCSSSPLAYHVMIREHYQNITVNSGAVLRYH